MAALTAAETLCNALRLRNVTAFPEYPAVPKPCPDVPGFVTVAQELRAEAPADGGLTVPVTVLLRVTVHCKTCCDITAYAEQCLGAVCGAAAAMNWNLTETVCQKPAYQAAIDRLTAVLNLTVCGVLRTEVTPDDTESD